MSILIIEDDKEINRLLATFLAKNGYDTISCFDGVDGFNKVRKYIADTGSDHAESSHIASGSVTIDMILLDMMLPGFPGDKLIKKIRNITDIPIIVISAVSSLDDRLFMMRSGADDYIIKPFDLRDVQVRIEAVLRRYRASGAVSGEKDSPEKTSGKKIVYGSIEMDTFLMTVYIGGEEINLTSKEYEILKLFLENQNKIFSKANIYESVWNEEYFPDVMSLKVHMSNLRAKLKEKDDFDYIETIWGLGYRLRKL